MSKSKQELAPKDELLPAVRAAIDDMEGTGFEDANADAYTIPFLRILQDLSPQVKKSESAYIKGAETGMIINTATQELFNGEEGVTVVPVHFRQTYIKWAPRTSGGGYMGEFALDSPEVRNAHKDGVKLFDAEGNELMYTCVHYVLLLKDGDVQPAVISLASTGIKKSKEWMMRMQSIKVDGQPAKMWSKAWHLKSIVERKGDNSWYGWKIEPAFWVNEMALLEAVRNFRTAIKGGQVKEKFEDMTEATDEYAGRSFDGEY